MKKCKNHFGLEYDRKCLLCSRDRVIRKIRSAYNKYKIDMKYINNFSEEARFLLQEAWMCWYCGMNTADCLHHIVGRGNSGSVVESSILNAAPLCNQKCHIKNHGMLRTDEWVSLLLKQTLKYIKSKGYKLERIDKDFMLKYAKFYK